MTLLIVDMQNDFLEGGSFAVPGADAAFVKAIQDFCGYFTHLVFTADNHPADHMSFGHFPPHCVQGTLGADLAIHGDGVVLRKGEDTDTEEFSAFIDGKNIGVLGSAEVYVVGVAGDYCVKETIDDILTHAPDKKVFAVYDLIKSVNGVSYCEKDYFQGQVTCISSEEVRKTLSRKNMD